MCPRFSKSTGFGLLALCWLLFSVSPIQAQSEPSSAPSLDSSDSSAISSQTFLQAVKDLKATANPLQQANLTLVLQYYSDKDVKKNQLIDKLSTSWQEEKAKALSDEVTFGLLAFAGGAALSAWLVHR